MNSLKFQQKLSLPNGRPCKQISQQIDVDFRKMGLVFQICFPASFVLCVFHLTTGYIFNQSTGENTTDYPSSGDLKSLQFDSLLNFQK